MDNEDIAVKLVQPRQTVHLLEESGASVAFDLYVNSDTGKFLVQCDLCRRYLVLGARKSITKLGKHRGQAKECRKQIRKQEAARMDALTRLEEAKAAAEVFSGIQSRTQSAIAPVTPPRQPFVMDDPGTKTPEDGTPVSLTPRPSISDFKFSENFREKAKELSAQIPRRTQISVPGDQALPFEQEDDPSSLRFGLNEKDDFCKGQWVNWYPGSVWDTYAYQQHEHKAIPWTLIGIDGGSVLLRSKACTKILDNVLDRKNSVCSACRSLTKSAQLQRFMQRATGEAEPHTPWAYLNFYQVRKLINRMSKRLKRLEIHARSQKRLVARLSKRIDDYKRIVMMISQKRITGVSALLATSLRNGDSPQAIYMKMESAINGTYRPRSKWTDREYDLAFLIKAEAGSRLLYALQMAEGYPSNTTLKRRKPIPELMVSTRAPSITEINANISSFLGKTGRKAPSDEGKLIGQVLMIDGIALEEACRYDHGRGLILGVCREHAANAPGFEVNGIEDIDNMAKAIFSDEVCHHGKDGTVVAIAPVTGTENYSPVPIVLSPSCKTESGEQLAQWVKNIISAYRTHPEGERLHGKITTLATDGESSFRTMRFLLGLTEVINRNSPLGLTIYKLPGINCYSGANGLITTCDPKHIIKRFATMIRSRNGIQLGDILVTPDDFLLAMTIFETITDKQAEQLLNPADKQNVPKAVNLLQTLLDIHNIGTIANPTHLRRVKATVFIATVLSYFLHPFIKVEMSLSEQIRSLSTYSHLITALFLQHRTGFMNSALFADSQAIVKNIIITTARFQTISPKIKYHILFDGTDRLEGMFSQVRTLDHAPNFDVVQLAHKISVAAEMTAIFGRHPDLDRGHARRNLINARGVDHVNPKSWIGDVEVGNVDLEKEYLSGRKKADNLLTEYFKASAVPWKNIDWNSHFANGSGRDHLRPEGQYIGSRAADQDPDDDDSGELEGGSLSDILTLSQLGQQESETDPTDFADARDEVDLDAEATEEPPSQIQASTPLPSSGKRFELCYIL